MKKSSQSVPFASQLKIFQLLLLVSWLIYLPSNVFLKLLPETGIINGIQVDYLFPKLYLTDLIMMGVLSLEVLIWIVGKLENGKTIPNRIKTLLFSYYPILLLMSLFIFRQVLTVSPLLALWQTGKLGLFIAFFVWLKNTLNSTKLLVTKTHVVLAICISLLLQSSLGLYQFLTQHSLAPYWLFGESQLHNQPFLARADFAWLDSLIGTNFGLGVLPYAMTPHPNVLAGFLAVGMVIILWLKNWAMRKKKQSLLDLFSIIALVISGVTLFLTQSVSAWMALALGVLILIFKNRLGKKTTAALLLGTGVLFLCLPFVLHQFALNSAGPSFLRRDLLNQTAWRMFIDNPVAGVGFHQFTAHLHEYDPANKLASFTQPAHHVGLLFLAENGVLGILILGVIILYLKKLKLQTTNYKLLATLTPLLALDHYLYSLQIGWLVVLLLIVISNISLTRQNHRNVL